MSINKILAFTIVAILFVLENGRSCAGEHFTVDQLLGSWFNVATTSSATRTDHKIFTCVTMNVTRSNYDKNVVIIVYHRVLDGELYIEEGYGQIIDSEFHVTFPKRTPPVSIHTITSYNDGKEMISESKTDKSYNILASRKPKVSAEALAAFEEIAKKIGGTVLYFPHDVCFYDEDGVESEFAPKRFQRTFKKH